RLRPGARRDDGGDDGDRQQPAGLDVPVRAAVHDGGGDRERVHRSGGRALPGGARRNRPGAVRHHAHGELAVATADLVDDAKRFGGRRRRTDAGAGGGARMSGEEARFGGASVIWRKTISSAFVAFCAVSVLIALVPLFFVLFFVVTQGLRALNL